MIQRNFTIKELEKPHSGKSQPGKTVKQRDCGARNTKLTKNPLNPDP
jgi:hypothetical protein